MLKSNYKTFFYFKSLLLVIGTFISLFKCSLKREVQYSNVHNFRQLLYWHWILVLCFMSYKNFWISENVKRRGPSYTNNIEIHIIDIFLYFLLIIKELKNNAIKNLHSSNNSMKKFRKLRCGQYYMPDLL